MARVLIVDDEEDQVRALAIGLRLEGFEVLTARKADAALRLLREMHADIAIVDLMMPGTNGLELARTLRDLHPETRVILTSAYPLSASQLAHADCGVVGFLPKPCALGVAAALVRGKLATAHRATISTVCGAKGSRAGAPSDLSS